MMDRETFETFSESAIDHNPSVTRIVASGLTPAEQTVFEICRDRGKRLEQEKIAQDYVMQRIKGAFSVI